MPLPAPIRLMAGPVLIGCFLNWFLFGALTIQLYDYHGKFQLGDRRGIKILVYGVFIIELVSTLLITNTTWTFIIVRWGQDTAFDRCPDTSPPTVAINSLVALTVHMFFAWRIWCLRTDWFGKAASLLTVVVALLACTCGLAFTYRYKAVNQELVKIVAFKPLMSLWLASTFGADALIALAMVIILTLARTDIGEPSKRIRELVNKLIVHSVETGTITAIVAAVQLTTFLLYPGTFIHLTPLYVLGRLYSNVLFAALNGRHRMRKLMNATYESGCVSSFRALPGPNADPAATKSQPIFRSVVGQPEIVSIPVIRTTGPEEEDDSLTQKSIEIDEKSLASDPNDSSVDSDSEKPKRAV